MPTVEYKTTSGQWEVPGGVTSVTVECIGGGAGGVPTTTNNQSHGGGGAGAYAKAVLTVSSGQTIDYTVGSGGGSNTGGGDTYWDDGSEVLAKGGSTGSTNTGGAGGSATDSEGETTYKGGDGGNSSGSNAGGGGGAAGPSGAGGDGGAPTAGTGSDTIDGESCDGGAGAVSSGAGGAGQLYGGAGGGAGRYGGPNNNGGAGAAGVIILTYEVEFAEIDGEAKGEGKGGGQASNILVQNLASSGAITGEGACAAYLDKEIKAVGAGSGAGESEANILTTYEIEAVGTDSGAGKAEAGVIPTHEISATGAGAGSGSSEVLIIGKVSRETLAAFNRLAFNQTGFNAQLPLEEPVVDISAVGLGQGFGQAESDAILLIASEGWGAGAGEVEAELTITLEAEGLGAGTGEATTTGVVELSARGTGTGAGTSSVSFTVASSAEGVGAGIGTSEAKLTIHTGAEGQGIGAGSTALRATTGIKATGTGISAGLASGLMEVPGVATGAGTSTGESSARLEIGAEATGHGAGSGLAQGNAVLGYDIWLLEAEGYGAGSGLASGEAVFRLYLKAYGAGQGAGAARIYAETEAGAEGSGQGSGQSELKAVIEIGAQGAGTSTGSSGALFIALGAGTGAGSGTGQTALDLAVVGRSSGLGAGTGEAQAELDIETGCYGFAQGTGSAGLYAHTEFRAQGDGEGAGQAEAHFRTDVTITGAGAGAGQAYGITAVIGTSSGAGEGTGQAKLDLIMIGSAQGEGIGAGTANLRLAGIEVALGYTASSTFNLTHEQADAGVRISNPIDLSPLGYVAEGTLSWSATEPSGTSIKIYHGLSADSDTQPEEYIEATSGDPILTAGQDVSGQYLWTRQVFIKTAEADPPRLHSLDIEITTLFAIEDGPLMEEVIFHYVPATQALEAIAERTGYWWKIDPYRRLYFAARDTYKFDFQVTEQDLIEAPVVDYGYKQYRNTQYVQGGKDYTVEQTEIQHGDDEKRAFAVGYPISRVPSVYVWRDEDVDWVEQTVGIKGLEDDKQFYWNRGDSIVTQDSGEEVLGEAERVKVVYIGEYSSTVITRSSEQIMERQEIEGVGTGIVEEIERDPGITGRDVAFQLANQLLVKHGKPRRKKLRFKTLTPGITAGRLLPVYLPEYGINHDLLVEQVSADYDDGQHLVYSITAVEGPDVGDWTKFFREILKRGELVVREGISEDEVLIDVLDFDKTWQEVDHPNPFYEVYPAEDLDPGFYPAIAPEHKATYLAWLDDSETELGRKFVTDYTGAEAGSDELWSLFLLDPFEANEPEMAYLAWYGGIDATAEPGSGFRMDIHDPEKEKFEDAVWQVEHTSYKGW